MSSYATTLHLWDAQLGFLTYGLKLRDGHLLLSSKGGCADMCTAVACVPVSVVLPDVHALLCGFCTHTDMCAAPKCPAERCPPAALQLLGFLL